MFTHAMSKPGVKSLNYLLVMPRLVRSVKDSYGFPLGIAYVSASMKKAGYHVSTLNLNQCDGKIYDILKSKIEQDQIDVVMTGGLSAEYCMIHTVLEAVKQINPKILTVVGGGIMTSDADPAMEALQYADIGVIGEGELTSVELCYALENDGDLGLVDGLVFKAGQFETNQNLPVDPKYGYARTKHRKEIADLDAIPWPDYDGFEMEKYLAATLGTFGFNGTNTLSMLTCRSCPFGCTFCFHTVSRVHRKRSLDDVFKELSYLVSKYKINSLALADDLFGLQTERLREFCTRIKEFNIPWLGAFRLNQVTPEMLEMLKDGNCSIMGFGLESADNRILKSMKKGLTIEQAEKGLKLVYDSGISISAGLIIGDIEETLETAHVTFKWWKEHPEYCIPMRLITPFPGTPIYKYAVQTGRIKDEVQFLKDGCPQINISKMTDEELQDFTKLTMDAAVEGIIPLSSFTLRKIDDESGCIDLDGECSICGQHNQWDKVRLFKITFVACKQCGQQFFPPLNADIRHNLDQNIEKIIQKYGKVGVWGMTIHTIDVFSQSNVLRTPNVFPIDICSSKQHNNFFGKQIYAPRIIAQEDLKTVIVSAPNHIGYIESQIETNYKNVTKVIDISNLIGTNFDVSELPDQENTSKHMLYLEQHVLSH